MAKRGDIWRKRKKSADKKRNKTEEEEEIKLVAGHLIE